MTDWRRDSVSVIVLALGLYTRSGRNRQLDQIGERTMIGHVVHECQTSKAKRKTPTVQRMTSRRARCSWPTPSRICAQDNMIEAKNH